MDENVDQGFHISPQQERLWGLQKMDGSGASAYRVRCAVSIEGELDADRLRRAVERLVARHEILRTTFPQLPGSLFPVQVIEEEEPAWSVRDLAGGDPEARLEELLRELDEAPFDLGRGPLWRATLARISEGRSVLLISLSALCADLASLDNLVAEIGTAYRGEDFEDDEPMQYADVAAVLREWLESEEEDSGLEYWRRQDLHALADVELPFGRTGSGGSPFRTRAVVSKIAPAVVAALEALAERHGSALRWVLLAGWQTLLQRFTGEPGTRSSVCWDGRTYEEFESALGPFARYLPCACPLAAGERPEDFLRRLAGSNQEVEEWQNYFSWRTNGSGAETAFWPFAFNYYRPPAPRPPAPRRAGDLSFSIDRVYESIDRYELKLFCVHRDGGLDAELHYDRDAFSEVDARRLARGFETLCRSLAEASDTPLEALGVLSREQRHFLLGESNDTRREPLRDRGRSFPCRFEERRRQVPESAAVAFEDRYLSYAELGARARRWARFLRRSGVGPEVRVAICAERSPEMLAAILGILEAGGAYLPLDPTYPSERLAFLLEDSRAHLLLAHRRLLPRLPAARRTVLLDRGPEEVPGDAPVELGPPAPESLAYLLYTSGSTGRPKGVMVSHRGLAHYLDWCLEAYPVTGTRGSLVHSPLGFDLTVTSLFSPLAAGGRVRLLPEDEGVGALAAALRDADGGYGLLKLTPAHLELLGQLLPPEAYAGCTRTLILGGEALKGESLEPWHRHGAGTRVVNEYGPTETVVGCSVFTLVAGELTPGAVPIGRPIADAGLYVLDRHFAAVPAGSAGELFIGGGGMARGYFGRPRQSAERFVPDPFSGAAGTRLYRSGDRVRQRADAQLEFLGRLDGQVKVRGFRIELGEIEAVLRQVPGVREAAVAAREPRGEAGGERRLAAYVVPRPGAQPATAELRAALEERLPPYMVPAAFVLLDALPLTANGKVDRRALPEPDWIRSGAREAYVPPGTPREEVLAAVWAQVLDVDRVGIDDDYFSLGGDSIRSLRLLALAEDRGVGVSLELLMRHPTIRALARALEAEAPEAAAALEREPFSLISPRDRQRLGPEIEDAYPLARLQAGMLFHSELEAGSAIYHDLHSFHLRGRFDLESLRTALRRAVERHAVLRTSFELHSFQEPLQRVHAALEAPLAVEDLRDLEPADRERAVAAWLEAEKKRRFDWQRPPLWRFQVHRRTEESFQLTLSFHHAVLDGWSAASLLTELFHDYLDLLKGTVRPRERRLATTYRDYVALEQEALASEPCRDYWRRRLADVEATRLPRWSAPRADGEPGRAALVDVAIPEATARGLRDLARSLAVPLKSVLLAAHMKVLGALTGRRRVLTGLVSNGRPETADGDQALGLFLNTLVFRTDLGAGSWRDLVSEVFAAEREALPFRRYPLAEMPRGEGGGPLFETLFNFLHYHVYDSLREVPGLEAVAQDSYEEIDVPLLVVFYQRSGSSGVELALNYRRDELTEAQVRSAAEAYRQALAALAADPSGSYGTADLLSAPRRHQVLAEWSAAGVTGAEAPARECLHHAFEARARELPERVAVVAGAARSSYRHLDDRADRLAGHLRGLGVGPEVAVGVCLERNGDLVAALLGVLKAGGFYVPLDPGYPARRLAWMTEDSRIRVLVAHGALVDRLPEFEGPLVRVDAGAPRIRDRGRRIPAGGASPESLAYVIYTSGSTGRPKGVAIRHAAAAALVRWAREVFTPAELEGVLASTSISFDLSVFELFAALGGGGRAILAGNVMELASLDAAAEVRLVNTVPSAIGELLGAGTLPPSVRTVSLAGEPLLPELAERLLRQPAVDKVWDLYGPSEDTTYSTFARRRGGDPATIGRPVTGTGAYVADGALRTAAPGAPGELCLAGAGLARGYLRRPAATAEKFVPDPFSGEAGGRLYKTGDLASHLADGRIRFLGRLDQQVKVRGFRIELGEVESALLAHPAVEAAVALAREDANGRRLLAAYVVARGAAPSAGELRTHLERRLPPYMAPSLFLFTGELPRTPSGKVDRAALSRRALPAEHGERAAAFAAPRTPEEELLAEIWSRLLGLERVGVRDDFFELGGESLLATRLISRVREAFQVDLPLRSLFDAPTVEKLAAKIRGLRTGGGPEAAPVEPAPRQGDLPLSFSQERLWFLHQLEPESSAYAIPAAVRLEGALRPAVLAACLDEVVRRHESLRTTFDSIDGKPRQVVAEPGSVRLPVIDLGALGAARAEAEVRRRVAEQARRPFDLARGPLMRVALLRLGARSHVLAYTMHHIVSDGWSMTVLANEVAVLYRAFSAGRPSPLPEPEVGYADFAVWQRRHLNEPALEAHLDYWREALRGIPTLLELPADRPRPAVLSSAGERRRWRLDEGPSRALGDLGQHRGATLFMTLLAAFQTLLSRVSGQTDVVVGTPVAGRGAVETEGMIGVFVNTLALRAELSDAPSFETLLTRVRDTVLAAHVHQDLPFERLIDEVEPERSLSHSPVFQAMFGLQTAPMAVEALPGLVLTPLPLDTGTAKFDLELSIGQAGGELAGVFEYSTDLFDATTLRRLAAHFRTLLAAAAAEPGRRIPELPLLERPERHQLLAEWNDAAVDFPAGGVEHLFEKRAEAAPEAVAAVCEGRTLSYRELYRRALLGAAVLAGRGVRREGLVALLLDRGLDFLTAVLATFEAGAAYLPLDPGHPPVRLRQVLAQSRAELVLVSRELRGVLTEALGEMPPESRPRVLEVGEVARPAPGAEPLRPLRPAAGDHLAYVIFTSGSTGVPKGAMVERRGMLNHLGAKILDLGLGRGDVVAQTATQTFDISVWQLLAALVTGGRVEVFRDAVALDPARLVDEVAARRVTILETVPSLMGLLLEEIEGARSGRHDMAALRWLIPTGEALPPGLIRRWFRHFGAIPLINAYGPTECSDDVTHHVLRGPLPAGAAHTPIGRPVANLRLYALDRGFRTVPPGVAGELAVAGVGVGRGYLFDPARTAEVFVPDPFAEGPGRRLYRTGDLGRFGAGGVLEFRGRLDHQVKVRGFRIELGEIETALRAHEAVADAVVVDRRDARGRHRLVAYVVAEDAGAGAAGLRQALGEELPDYMVPAVFVFLDALPLSPNGKIDRRSLPDPDEEQGASEAPFTAPGTPAEIGLAEVWRQVLGVERVGVHDNFFELGGDSILAIQIVSRANRAGLGLAPRDLFRHQTLSQLAAAVRTAPEAPADRGPVTGEVPLTPIQRDFFAHETEDRHHYNQAVLLEVRETPDPARLERALAGLLAHHDALRLRYRRHDGAWTQVHAAPEDAPPAFHRVALGALEPAARAAALEAVTARAQGSLDLARGPLLRLILFDFGPAAAGRLLLVAHHLVIDGVSWRILLEDLEEAYEELGRGETVRLAPKTLSFQGWARRLEEMARDIPRDERREWVSEERRRVAPLPVDFAGGDDRLTSQETVAVSLGAPETRALLQDLPGATRTRIDDVLLTALALALSRWTGSARCLVDLEGHGRDAVPDADVSRTLGWFTVLFPVVLDVGDAGPLAALRQVKERLRSLPRRGVGHGLLRYLSDEATARELASMPPAEVSFNYFGQLDRALAASQRFAPAAEALGPLRSGRQRCRYRLEVDARVAGGELRAAWKFSRGTYRRSTVEAVAREFLRALGSLIDEGRRSGPLYTPSDFPLAELGWPGLDRLTADGRPFEDVYPLSPMQEGMFFHTLYAPHTEVYFEQFHCKLRGELDADAFRRAWQEVADRLGVLRTDFVWEGFDAPLQVVREKTEVPLATLDWRELDAGDQERRLETLLQDDRRRGFDLAAAPLLRLTLVHLAPGSFALVASHHHLLLDGWSLGLLWKEVLTCYEALHRGESPNRPAGRPYREYVAWLRRQDPEKAREFWQGLLEGFNAPTSFLREAEDEPAAGSGGVDLETRVLELPETDRQALEAAGRRRHLTLNSLLQGAWAVLLSRYSGADDVVFGATVSGRPPELGGVESMIGLFINTLPVRARLDLDGTLLSTLEALQEQQAELRQYEYSSLVEVQGWSQVPRGLPLFESILVFENFPVDSALRQGGGSFTADEVVAFEKTNYPLTFAAVPGEGLTLRLHYDPRRLDSPAAGRALGHLRTLLSSMAGGLDQPLRALRFLAPAERHQLLSEWAQTPVGYRPEHGLHELFEAQARRTPEAAAAVFEAACLSYRSLDRRANRLARHLRSLGVGPEVRVGICVERSLEMVVGVLGVLKAGGAYLPLDPELPEERLAYLAADARVPVLLLQARFLDKAPAEGVRAVVLDEEPAPWAAESGEKPESGAGPDNLAYLIYTSGSTGLPKGALLAHRGVTNMLLWRQARYPLDGRDRVLQTDAFSFDPSVWQLFWPLAVGAQLILPRPGANRDPAYLARVLKEERITVVGFVPSSLQLVVDEPELSVSTALRHVVCGGEALRPAPLERFLSRVGAEFHNVYGPTEASIDTTDRTFTSRDDIGDWAVAPIGRPLGNKDVYVLDAALRPVPPGVAGELFVGGSGLARGYHSRPGLTAERFVPHPLRTSAGGDARLYRTGDLVRYRRGGEIEFLGRIDHQVKVRGFRIELGEIEAVLEAHDAVIEAAVLAREDVPGDKRLVAYLAVADPEDRALLGPLRGFLQGRLPHYMVPAVFVLLDALPTLASGKLDRRALPAPDLTRPELESTYVAPRGAVEEVLAGIWAELLGFEKVGVYDNFFELGGHSLLATRIMARIRDTFQVRLDLHALFDSLTVAGLAEALTADAGERQRIEATAEVVLQLAGMSDEEVEGLLDEATAEHREESVR